MNGADNYLEFYYSQSGAFYTLLFQLIASADRFNRLKLAEVFPEEVQAYQTFTEISPEAFSQLCHPDHPLLKKFLEEYALLPDYTGSSLRDPKRFVEGSTASLNPCSAKSRSEPSGSGDPWL